MKRLKMFISIYNLALFGMLICSHVSADSPQQYQTAQPQMQTYEGHLPTDHNNTMLEIIEKLLQSRREGRNLDDQFNQVYADGHIDQALMQGNDVEARNLIRDKLCGLGLMSCDYEEKRPFYSTIYAQEMPPPPNYHGGPPQRPPPNYHHGPPPPHRIGYGEAPFKGNGRPPTGPGGSYGGPYLEHPPTGAGFGEHGGPTFDKPPPGAVIYGSKPPGPIFTGNGPTVDSHQSPPYAFESFNPVDKIKIGGSSGGLSFYAQQQQQQQITDTFPAPTNVVVGGSSGSNKADLQQHVHHHYHHLEGAAAANAKVPTVAIPVGGIQSINTDFSTLAQSSAAFNIDQSSSAFAAGFNNAGHGSLLSQQSGSIGDFGGPVHKPNGELYKPPYSLNSLPTPNNELYQPSGSSGIGSFGQGGFAPSSGSYHSQNPDYFKKELHNYGSVPSGNFNSLSTGYGASQYGETARQQFVDCKCVPFNQCPAADRIGRKEDLILPIDPRNLPKDIEALSEVPANATNDATTVSDNTQEKKETNAEGESKRSKRDVANATDKQSNDEDVDIPVDAEGRAYYGNRPQSQLQYQTCSVNEVCCRRPLRPQAPPVPPQAQFGRCGVRNAAGITGRIKNPSYVDGDAEFGEYPWHVAILKKDPNESIYACGGTLIDAEHVITAAHCIKSQNGFDLRARLGEWDVNHDVEFFPYIERDVVSVQVHPEYYAGTLDNDLAVLKLDSPVDFTKNPHISPACLPDKFSDWTGARCWTTGWGKDAFGEHGKYQNILKEVDVPILSHHQCETQLRQTRLGYSYKLNPGFICAGGEEGKDACKGDGGGPLVCERNGVWNAVGIVSWGIGCGQVNVPGVYVRVAHYLDWIQQVTRYYKK